MRQGASVQEVPGNRCWGSTIQGASVADEVLESRFCRGGCKGREDLLECCCCGAGAGDLAFWNEYCGVWEASAGGGWYSDACVLELAPKS